MSCEPFIKVKARWQCYKFLDITVCYFLFHILVFQVYFLFLRVGRWGILFFSPAFAKNRRIEFCILWITDILISGYYEVDFGQ